MVGGHCNWSGEEPAAKKDSGPSYIRVHGASQVTAITARDSLFMVACPQLFCQRDP